MSFAFRPRRCLRLIFLRTVESLRYDSARVVNEIGPSRIMRVNPDSLTPGATQIEMGDGSRHSLYTTTSQPEGWMTSGFWVYNRDTSTLKMPNGVTYAFGHYVYLNTRLGFVRYPG